jgi:hypothetical protein
MDKDDNIINDPSYFTIEMNQLTKTRLKDNSTVDEKNYPTKKFEKKNKRINITECDKYLGLMNDTVLLEDYKQSDFHNAICVDTISENLQISEDYILMYIRTLILS